MGREQYKTPDTDVSAEFDRVCQLFQLALGKPSDRVLFDSLMVEANDRGLNWIQGLEYVIERRGGVNAAEEADRDARKDAVSYVPAGLAMRDELRQAG